jgi:endoglucanase
MARPSRRRVLAVAAAFAAGLCRRQVQAAQAAWLETAWQMYKERFVTPEGRVTDDANGGVSHSEGQGYGMLLAVRVDDRSAFERIWGWTKANLLVRSDGLAAWRYNPKHAPPVADINNATDGDLLIAWALLEAGTRWRQAAYLKQARRTSDAIMSVLVVPSRWGPALMPGATGFGPGQRKDGPVVNLSYWIFPALARLKDLPGVAGWKGLEETGFKLIDMARFGPARLPANWISLAGETPSPAKGFPSVFGYDAVRIPLYLGWAQPEEKERLAAFARAFDAPPAVIDVGDGKPVEPLQGQGFAAIAAFTRNRADGIAIPQSLWNVQPEFYYPTTLHILSLLAAVDAAQQKVK